MNNSSSKNINNFNLYSMQNKNINSRFIFISFIFTIFLFIYQNTLAAHHGVSRFGHLAQIFNPIIAGFIANQERGVKHFAIIYGQNTLVTNVSKLTGHFTKWNLSKRPKVGTNQKDKYEGMPSGHTSSAWSAPSYLRVFGGRYKFMSIPLYVTAAITAYSRVRAKMHTIPQVITAAILTEMLTKINARSNWNNKYRSISFRLGAKSASFKINFQL